MSQPTTHSKLSLSPRKRKVAASKQHTPDQVRQQLEAAFSFGQNPSQVFQQLLEECQSEAAEPCRFALFEHCITAINNDTLQSLVAKEIIGRLLVEVDLLSGNSLYELAELLVRAVQEGRVANGRSLDLFPKILATVAVQHTVCHNKESGGQCELEGAVLKSQMLANLCSCKWEPSSVVHVADMCKGIPMTSLELEALIEKILRTMTTLGLPELAPLVYQLLVLSNQGHKTLVLEGVRALFNKLDRDTLGEPHTSRGEDVVASGSVDELLQTEGTVILHISFALKQNQELGKEFIKNMKAAQARPSSHSLSLFSMALALSVTRIHRFEDAVLSFLKEVTVRCYKQQERKRASKWMQEVHKDSFDIEQLLLQTVKNSMCGWDHVVQGLVTLGFTLMECYAPKTSGPVTSSPQYKACCLGSELLKHTFQVHSVVREEVVGQLINKVLTNAASYVSHYIMLLSEVLAGSSQAVLDSLARIKEVFSYLTLLPPAPAVSLLQALLPSVQYSASVRDALLLILRKALFSRSLDSRKIAVGGYLLLLKKLKVLTAVGFTDSEASQATTSSSQQVMVEIHGTSVSSGNEALCLEILGTLHRCLSQQREVKMTLYEGLFSVFCANPKLAGHIIELLLTQLQGCYEQDEELTPPVRLEPCLSVSGSGEKVVVEPLDSLVRCLQLCVGRFSEWSREGGEGGARWEGEAPDVIDQARGVLQSLAVRMAKSDPEDFELDRSGDFSASTVGGQRNRAVARLVLGLYETLIEYTFSTGEFSRASCEEVVKLFQCHQRVSDILLDRPAAGAKRGGGGGGGGSKGGQLSSRLTLQCVIRLLRGIMSDVLPAHQPALSLLRESLALVKYLLSSALAKIHLIDAKGALCEEGFAQQSPDRVFKSCSSLARVLFKQLDSPLPHRDGSSKKEKGKSVPVMCLEGFHDLLQTVALKFPGKMEGFLGSVNPAVEEGAGRSETVHFFIRHFQRVVLGVFNEEVREWSHRDCQAMLGCTSLLAAQLESGSPQLSQTLDWTHTLCKEYNIDDAPLTKVLVSLLLTLTAREKESIKLLRKLSEDVHYHLGDIDECVQLEGRPHFAIVNPRTATSCITGLVVGQVEAALADAGWLLARLKTTSLSTSTEELYAYLQSPTQSSSSQAQELGGVVCERLGHLVGACSALIQSTLPPGPCTDNVIKLVTKTWEVLGDLAKHMLSVYPQTLIIPAGFRKLVQYVASDLQQQVYSFITYFQAIQEGVAAAADNVKGKKGGKGKPKAAKSSKGVMLRQSRFIPNLIYAVEQFEKFLIQLGKKAKVQLMDPFKKSTVRDFRINAQEINAAFNEEEEEEGESVDGESSGEGEALPRAKKLKK